MAQAAHGLSPLLSQLGMGLCGLETLANDSNSQWSLIASKAQPQLQQPILIYGSIIIYASCKCRFPTLVCFPFTFKTEIVTLLVCLHKSSPIKVESDTYVLTNTTIHTYRK